MSVESKPCPKCECRYYPEVETRCPVCGYYPPPPLPPRVKPFGWDVSFEYRGEGGQISTKMVHRVGPISKARRAARLHSGFIRITEERHITTEAGYRAAYGNYDQRM